MKSIVMIIGIVFMMGCMLSPEVNISEENIVDSELLGNWESEDGVIISLDNEYITISYDFIETVYNYGYYSDGNNIVVLNNKMFTTTYEVIENILYIKDITFIKMHVD